MVKTTTLETTDLTDVEILAVGTWNGNKKVTITEDDIKAFVDSFDEISADSKLNYEPPAKLGHNEEQKLLQADGLPSAGWVSKLRVKAGKLVADFRGVPAKLAEIIRAGGYKKVSAEFYQNFEIGGKKYPWVLKAVAFLGADIPAVKTIADIAAQYAEGMLMDENHVPYNAVIFGEATTTLDEIMTGLDEWLAKAEGVIKGVNGAPTIRTYLKEVKSKLTSMIKKDSTNNSEISVPPEAVPAAATESINEKLNTEVQTLDEKSIRELLKLDEKADVLATVKALKEKAESATTTLAEQAALSDENKALKTKLAESDKVIAMKERDERVGNAINAGKITPAQKPWAEQYAMSDPKGFDAFVASAPKVVELGEKGKQGGDEPATTNLSEGDIKAFKSINGREPSAEERINLSKTKLQEVK